MDTSDGDTQLDFFRRLQEQAFGPDSAAASLAQASEPELIALYQGGTPAEAQQVLAELFRRFGAALWQHARRQELPLEDAQNVFGQTWIVVARRLITFQWQGVSLAAWLRSIVDRLCLGVKSGLARTDLFSEADTQAAAEQVPDSHFTAVRDLGVEADAAPADSPELDRFLIQIRGCLRPSDQRLLELLYFKGFDAPQAAEALGKTPAAVRKAHERLRERLSACAVQHGFRLPPNWRLFRNSQ